MASEFTRNFGRYRMLAQREAVAVSSHGSITGYFVAPDEYEEFQRFKQRRRSFATAELPDEKAQAIGATAGTHILMRWLTLNSRDTCRSQRLSLASSFPTPICGTPSMKPLARGRKILVLSFRPHLFSWAVLF
ncbi:MAG: hypothetical protein WB495_27895 [Xanthobacteraceae bacterium]